MYSCVMSRGVFYGESHKYGIIVPYADYD
jgi:hypothetical protein